MGASYLTTIFGAAAILGSIVQLISYTLEEGGVPHDPSTWINFGTKVVVGIGLILTKSFNVSNSPTPVAPAVVSDAAAVKPNPAVNP